MWTSINGPYDRNEGEMTTIIPRCGLHLFAVTCVSCMHIVPVVKKYTFRGKLIQYLVI